MVKGWQETFIQVNGGILDITTGHFHSCPATGTVSILFYSSDGWHIVTKNT
jgi:hypothetical protein